MRSTASRCYAVRRALFGRNASAGLISIITAKPKFKTEIGGELTSAIMTFAAAEAYATGGLTETIAARIDGVWMQRDGFLEDVISGRDINDRDRWMLRGPVAVRTVERPVGPDRRRLCQARRGMLRRALPAGIRLSRRPNSLRASRPSSAAWGRVVSDDTFERDMAITPGRSYRSDVKDYGLSGEIVYDLGRRRADLDHAYRYNKYIRGQDADFNNLDILFRDDDGTAFNHFKTFTQELRFQGEARDGRLDWLVGGYYANEKLRSTTTLPMATIIALRNCLVAAHGRPGLIPTATYPAARRPASTGACDRGSPSASVLEAPVLRHSPQAAPPPPELLNSLIAASTFSRSARLVSSARVGPRSPAVDGPR